MTTGFGFSIPLDPTVRIRIRLDGESAPRVDLPLPDLFSGVAPPFTYPLAADRTRASGGYLSYVPIPYRRGCRVSLVNGRDAFLWFQVTFHRLPEGADVPTFTGREDLSALRAGLSAQDPWASSGGTLRGAEGMLAPAEELRLTFDGPGLLTALRVQAPPSARESLRVRLAFDGRETVNVSLAGFFAAGRADPARSLLLGEKDDGWLACLFPMPFFERAEVRVVNAGSLPADVRLSVRRLAERPPTDSGLFCAVERGPGLTDPPADARLFLARGRGKWVGLFAELGSAGSPEYLEGDERVYVDGSPHPAWYGTGVEDLFGGGFSFDAGPFAHPLCGMSYSFFDAPEESVTAALRLFLTDALPFDESLDARIENGPTGRLPMRLWSVSYLYARPDPALADGPAFDVADHDAAARAAYRVAGDTACAPVSSAFESEPEEPRVENVCARGGGSSRFRLPATGLGPRVRLRRRFDAATAGQAADVFVNGALAGRFPPADANPFRRFREQEVEMALPARRDVLDFEVAPVLAPGERFTEIRWELRGAPRVEAAPAAVSGSR